MARSLFKKALEAVGANTADRLRQRIQDAEQAVRDAEQDYRSAVLETEAGGDPAAEAAAEAALVASRQQVNRLTAALQEVDARNAAADRAAQAKRQAAEDAEIAKACDAVTKAAQGLASAIPAYAKAYDGLIEADQRLRSLAAGNPRARPDLLSQNIDGLVSLELTRAGGDRPPPGFDRWAATSRDARELTPLADHFDGLASVIKEGLGHE